MLLRKGGQVVRAANGGEDRHANRSEKLAPFDRPGIVVLDARKAHRPAELLNLLNYGEQPAIEPSCCCGGWLCTRARALEAQDARDQIRRVHIRRAGRVRQVERAAGASGSVVRPTASTSTHRSSRVARTPYSTRCARRRGRAASCSRCRQSGAAILPHVARAQLDRRPSAARDKALTPRRRPLHCRRRSRRAATTKGIAILYTPRRGCNIYLGGGRADILMDGASYHIIQKEARSCRVVATGLDHLHAAAARRDRKRRIRKRLVLPLGSKGS